MVTGGYKGLQGVTGDFKGLQGVTWGYRVFQGVTRGYMGLRGLQWVTRGYKGLQGLTRDYRRLQAVTGVSDRKHEQELYVENPTRVLTLKLTRNPCLAIWYFFFAIIFFLH